MKTIKHWKLEKTDQIYHLIFDHADSETNVINLSVFNELEKILVKIKKDKLATGLVLTSGKANGFIAGADIKAFKQDFAQSILEKGHKVFEQLEELNIPTIAVINGFCLGGGLELALACDYRIADINRATFGFPEVLLGLHPGWGGTIRLPKLVSAKNALKLMMTGRSINAKKWTRFAPRF